MSTLKVDSIESRTSGNRVVLPDVNNHPPFRNIIINGDMSIAQRATSATSIDSTNHLYITLDRWCHIQQADDSNTGKTSMEQSTDVPTGQGFANSLKIDCTTAQTSISGNNSRVTVNQRIEGQNLQYLKKGTSSAQSTTLSFWVKSSKTGTYICALRDKDNSRDIAKSYTISSANTWEKKTITYEGDTTGAFDNDNARSLDVIWGLAAGSDYSSGTLQTTWGTANTNNLLVGQVNLMDSTDNDWYITGVQLEAGDSATPFEFLPHDVNLQRCLRYFEHSYNSDTAPADGIAYGNTITTYQGTAYTTSAMRCLIKFQEPKRTTPTVTLYNVTGLYSGTTANRWGYWTGSSWTQGSSNTVAGEIEEKGMDVDFGHSGFTQGYSYLLGGGWSASCEL